MSAHGLGVLITVLAAALLSFVVFWMTGKGESKDWFMAIREKMGLTGLHPVLVIFLSTAWAALFLTLLAGIFWVLFAIGDKVSAASGAEGLDLRWYLLTLTAVTAALGAVISLPFTLIKTALNRRQTETSEQGLITDRINKAVEGLGAVKETNWIGRSVEILEIHPNFEPDDFEDAERLKNPPKRTEIQWQGEPSPVQPTETQGKVGQWEVFTASEPNLEVRIGAIYALERISQDSARDHIQIMEILCAYVRENAGLSDPFDIEGNGAPQVTKPRSDVAAAIKVIGRRPKQMRDEARQFLSASTYSQRFDMRNIDLSGADLRDLTFSEIDFSGSSFRLANMMNAKFENVLFNGSNFCHASTRTARAIGETIFNFSLFSGIESLQILEPLPRDKVLWCALKSTAFNEQQDLDNLTGNKRTMLSVWFGDGSVEWPITRLGETPLAPPNHWPQSILDWDSFKKEWDKWLDRDWNYAPTNPPKPAK